MTIQKRFASEDYVNNIESKLSEEIDDLKENSASSWNDLTDKPFSERFEEVTMDLNEYISEWMVADETNSLIMTEVQLQTDLGLYIGGKVKFTFDDKELAYTLEDLSAVVGEGWIGCGDISSMVNGDLSTINFIFVHGFVDGAGQTQMILKGSTPTVANLISEVAVVDKLDRKFYEKSLPEVTENDNENVAMVVDGKWTSAPIGRRWRVLYDKTTTDGKLDSFFVNIGTLLGKGKINELLFQVELPDEVNDATKIKVGELNKQIEFNIPEIREHIHIYISVAEGEYFIVSAFSFNLKGEGAMMFPIRLTKVTNAPNLNYFSSVAFDLFNYTDAVKIPNGARCRILGR